MNNELFSSQGSRQGGNESSLLFAIPIQQVLKKLKLEHPTVEILAILDDINLVAENPHDLITAYHSLLKTLKTHLSLDIQSTKCSFTYFNLNDGIDALDCAVEINQF